MDLLIRSEPRAHGETHQWRCTVWIPSASPQGRAAAPKVVDHANSRSSTVAPLRSSCKDRGRSSVSAGRGRARGLGHSAPTAGHARQCKTSLQGITDTASTARPRAGPAEPRRLASSRPLACHSTLPRLRHSRVSDSSRFSRGRGAKAAFAALLTAAMPSLMICSNKVFGESRGCGDRKTQAIEQL
jgi:hypothetical protein